MNPPLPVVSGADVFNALADAGFAQVGQRGSHVELCKAHLAIIAPLHRELAPGTPRTIIRKSGLPVEEFLALV